jgi:hypothetical protein
MELALPEMGRGDELIGCARELKILVSQTT